MEAPSNATAHAKIMKMRQKNGVQKRVNPPNRHQNCKHRICWVLGRSLPSRFPAGMSFASLFAVQQISSRFPAIFEVAGSTSGRKHVQAQPRFLENVVPSGVSTYRRNEWPSRFPADLRLPQISSRFPATYLMPAWGVITP